MGTIQLIVTGDMEELSLHLALKRAFPDLEFWKPIKITSFTSKRLAYPPPPRAESPAIREVDKVVNAHTVF